MWIKINVVYIVRKFGVSNLNLIHLPITRIIKFENTIDSSRNPFSKHFLKYQYYKNN